MILQILTKDTKSEKSQEKHSEEDSFFKRHFNDTPYLNKEFEKMNFQKIHIKSCNNKNSDFDFKKHSLKKFN